MKIILIIAAIWAMVYLLTSAAFASFDLSLWEAPTRGFICGITGIVTLGILMMTYLDGGRDDD